jgi:hypothetical protein
MRILLDALVNYQDLQKSGHFFTSGLRRDADEICAVLGYKAASSGNPLLTFTDHSTLLYTPEQRRSHGHFLTK